MRFYINQLFNSINIIIISTIIFSLELKSVDQRLINLNLISNSTVSNSIFVTNSEIGKEKVAVDHNNNSTKENIIINENVFRPFKQETSKNGKLSINEELEALFLRHKNRKEIYLNQQNKIIVANHTDNKNETIVAEIKTNIQENIDGKLIWKNAVDFGIESLEELVKVKEPSLYNLGLFLKQDVPAMKIANFGAPKNVKALLMSRIGYASVEASKKIAQTASSSKFSRKLAEIFSDPLLKTVVLNNECPFRESIRCPLLSKKFRTADGTCNNPINPWKGSSLVPMQRFLPPVYEDGIETIRKSIFGTHLPSARLISKTIHRKKNRELQSVTLMFMQWGQFIDHDVTSTVKSTSFNESIPRCCDEDGRKHLHPNLLHPSCLPIDVPKNDQFLSRFSVRCMEFIRSAPSIQIDCNLGWREQINQVTSYIDASTIYGSDVETSNSMRAFRNGKIFYGRPLSQSPLDPPDPPDGEICKQGAVSDECLQTGDGRFSENIGLTAIHTIFVRYHNKLATILARLNQHWNDERVFQETRRIAYSAIQHITYREFLPLLVGPEVMELFELKLLKKGYYKYNLDVNPTIANAFSTAAFRFGHSLVQNSFIRFNSHHKPLINNVSLHDEFRNFDNIWTRGSVDRLILGLVNQPIQKRDEYISDELTDHLFQFSSPFGMDLIAVNIQRGRDHGIPPYTSWRKPCGLSPIKDWTDLEKVMNVDTLERLRLIYHHVEDIDLYTGGLAEKPVKGAVAGPTFACIIAQQFLVLRKGDRFWYENGEFTSSFSPAQLQQIRQISLAQIICQTMDEVETIQPFVFLSSDSFRNIRQFCDTPEMSKLDLEPWIEQSEFALNNLADNGIRRLKRDTNRTNKKTKIKLTSSTAITRQTQRPTTTTRPNRKKNNVTTPRTLSKRTTSLTYTKDYSTSSTVKRSSSTKPTIANRNRQPGQYYQIQNNHDEVTYLLGIVPEQTTRPTQLNPSVQVNINIHYSTPSSELQQLTNHIGGGSINTYGHPVTVKRPDTVDYPVFVYTSSNDRLTNINNQFYQLPNGHKKPNLNGYVTVTNPNINRPYETVTDATSAIGPYHTYLTNDNLDLITTENYNLQKPTNADHFHFDIFDPSSTATHKPIVYENRPFASSNVFPNQQYNSNKLYYSAPTIGAINPRPIETSDSEEILNEFFDNQRSTTNMTKKIQNLQNNRHKIDDKLDFKTNGNFTRQMDNKKDNTKTDKLYFHGRKFRNIIWRDSWIIPNEKDTR